MSLCPKVLLIGLDTGHCGKIVGALQTPRGCSDGVKGVVGSGALSKGSPGPAWGQSCTLQGQGLGKVAGRVGATARLCCEEGTAEVPRGPWPVLLGFG